MSRSSHVSLIDLSRQLPFEIDAKLKDEICFTETLIISCGHYEGENNEVESTLSESSCSETSEDNESTVIKQNNIIEVKDIIEEEVKEEENVDEESNDFHFYFFPDCKKPQLPTSSKDSIVVVNGMPKISASAKDRNACTCELDKRGKCTCYFKLPCSCGDKTKAICTCADLKEVCICNPLLPETVCKCKNKSTKVCICNSDNMIKPTCTCSNVEKPCVCDPKKYPSPVCKCPHKLQSILDKMDSIIEGEEAWKSIDDKEIGEEFETKTIPSIVEETQKLEPCTCQEPELKKLCYCPKNNECICETTPCICGIQRFRCLCQSSDFNGAMPCNDIESKSICNCKVPEVCLCDAESNKSVSRCVSKEKICTCGNPEKCNCYITCECKDPCICDTAPPKPNPKDCSCLLDLNKNVPGLICTCRDNKSNAANKLKKVRAGKHGYRWCHEVDPHHTFFGYSYGKYDRIEPKEIEPEIFKISGLYDEASQEKESPLHTGKSDRPQFVKKVRKPSIDCCSAVGGISMCVETLGEDKDKFLIQVVSHSSKEGAKTGSKLVSIIDCNLHTMEENRSEHITRNDSVIERKSYMAICESGYYNKVTRICGEKNVVKRIYHQFDIAREFLLEGANIVLMRYLALRRYKGQIKTDTVLMDGVICESVYVCPGVSQGLVNGKPMFVVKIERHIIEPSGRMQQTLTTLTLRGYIISHEWADSNYIFHINPLLRVFPENDEIEQHAPLREKWREDMQLLSDYLDFKSTRTSEGGRYVVENGTITNTVRDYLQAILLLRPQDTLQFTRHYFSSVLSALDIPHDEYFDPCAKHVRYYYFED